jgi:RNA polymerase sigma-70 factor (ECF subfamily)
VVAWVANHVISDHRRIERRRLVALERLLADEREHATSPTAGLTSEVVRALRRLPAADRDRLLLMVWGELSRDEVAAALGIPAGPSIPASPGPVDASRLSSLRCAICVTRSFK